MELFGEFTNTPKDRLFEPEILYDREQLGPYLSDKKEKVISKRISESRLYEKPINQRQKIIKDLYNEEGKKIKEDPIIKSYVARQAAKKANDRNGRSL